MRQCLQKNVAVGPSAANGRRMDRIRELGDLLMQVVAACGRWPQRDFGAWKLGRDNELESVQREGMEAGGGVVLR